MLDTDAFSDEDAGDDSGSQGEAEEELPDLDDEEWERQLEAVSAAQPLATAAAPLAGGGGAQTAGSGGKQGPTCGPDTAGATGVEAGGSQGAPPGRAAASAEVASPGVGHTVDELLGELLGEEPASTANSTAQQGTAAAAAPAAAARLPVPATPAASRPPHAGGQLQPSAVLQQQAAPALPGKAIQPQRAAVAATRPAQDEHDEELDMLLGLGTDQGAAPLPAVASSKRPAPAPAPAAQQGQQSLEDWLDAL